MHTSLLREAPSISRTIERFGITVSHAEGCTLFTAGGDLVDLTGGLGTSLLGYGAPTVREAIVKQAERLIHVPWHLSTDVKLELLDRLSVHFPNDTRFLPCISGTDAVEAALKTVRARNPRGVVLSFRNAYHGKSVGTLDVTDSPRLQRLRPPSTTNALRLPYPSDRGAGTLSSISSNTDTIARTHELIDQLEHAGDDVVALLVEPVQGAFMTAPERSFLRELRALTLDRGIALIVDEIFTAFRTGSVFAYQEAGVHPDLTIFGKALGAGLPVSFVAGRPEYLDELTGAAHTGTFQANALACAAALATLDIIEPTSFHQGVTRTRHLITSEIDNLRQEHGWALTGRGLMMGINLNASGEWSGVGLKVQESLLQNGIFVLEAADHLRLSPPACLSAGNIGYFRHALEVAFGKIA